MSFLSNEFMDFIKEDCNRKNFIISYLQKKGVKTVIMPIGGKTHIYVVFPKEQYSNNYRIKTIIAHYDRTNNSPGANDNSSSVFSLMKFAVKVNNKNFKHNIRMIFTDGEELTNIDSKISAIKQQGAFALANLFKKLDITNDEIYVFDCTGRGDTAVLGNSYPINNMPKKFKEKYILLAEKTLKILKTASCENFTSLPITYSDNAGFIACGLPAVLITILPKEEVKKYLQVFTHSKVLIKNDFQKFFKEKKSEFYEFVPQTWKLINCENDTADTLTPQAFELTEKILDLIAESKNNK